MRWDSLGQTEARGVSACPRSDLVYPLLVPGRQVLGEAAVGDVVLVDVAHVDDRLATDRPGYGQLDVVEPDIGIEAHLRRQPARLGNAAGARIVGSEAERQIGRASCRERVCQYG